MRHAHLVAAAAALAVGLLVVRLRRAPSAPPPVPSATLDAVAPHRAPGRARRGGMDITFLVTADTHAGYAGTIAIPGHPEGVGVEDVHEVVIATMNDIAGTPFPAALGGTVGKPRGVLVAGDLTENGRPGEWARFEAMYGLTGADGWLRYPVYEGAGNHDVWGGPYVKAQVAKRHGGARYAWDWDDLHVVCLGEGPDLADLAWLRDDLAATSPDAGVVVFFHYPLTGPSPGDTWFAAGPFRDELARVLLGYRVLGIFSGHLHTSGRYTWMGHDAYLEGSVKHAWHSFSVVHVTDTRWTVASYNYDRHAFWWWHEKPVFGAAGEERSWFSEGDARVGHAAGRR